MISSSFFSLTAGSGSSVGWSLIMCLISSAIIRSTLSTLSFLFPLFSLCTRTTALVLCWLILESVLSMPFGGMLLASAVTEVSLFVIESIPFTSSLKSSYISIGALWPATYRMVWLSSYFSNENVNYYVQKPLLIEKLGHWYDIRSVVIQFESS